MSVTLLLSITQSYAQNGFFTEISSLTKQNITFQECGFSQERGGKPHLESWSKVKIKLVKDKFGNFAGFETTLEDNGKVKPNENYNQCRDKIDHYTHPMRSSKGNGYHYMAIDSVIYGIRYANEDFSKYEIYALYIPLLSKSQMPKEKKENKPKGLLKFATKLTEKMGGNSFVLAQSSMDHYKKVDEYIKAMKNTQKANPYSAETQKKVDALIEDCKKKSEEIQKFNEEYMQSDEYKEIQERNAFFEGKKSETAQTSVTIKNMTGEIVAFGNAVNVTSSNINPGSEYQANCKSDVYLYKSINNSYKKVRLVSAANSNCKGVVEVK